MDLVHSHVKEVPVYTAIYMLLLRGLQVLLAATVLNACPIESNMRQNMGKDIQNKTFESISTF